MTVLFKKKVLVMGLGLFGGGLGVTRFLAREGARVTVTDLRSEEDLRESVEALKGLPVSLKLGGHDEADFLAADLIVANPAVPRHSDYLSLAERTGVPVTTEINLFFERCRGRIMGITGSSGKTTTTLLAGEILRRAYPETHVGGNLGRPLIEEVDGISPDAPVILELSSFQLDRLRDLDRSPNISIITNFSPNHIDIHGSLEAYRTAKQGILEHQLQEDLAILNADDPEVAGWTDLCRGSIHRFSGIAPVERGVFLRDGQIQGATDNGIVPICQADELQLPGAHNLSNALAATTAGIAMHVDLDLLADTLRTFEGAEHRLEFVTEIDGVHFVNDSIATSPDRSVAALLAFDQPILLIAGGYDKKIPFDALGPIVAERVRSVFLIGATTEQIAGVIEGQRGPTTIHRCGSLEEAIDAAAGEARSGEVVLLSPACASYGMFRNFEERGKRFKERVKEIGKTRR